MKLAYGYGESSLFVLFPGATVQGKHQQKLFNHI